MFIPSLSLRNDGGRLNLIARVEAPNGCFQSGGFEPGWPNGMAGLPETIPIQLIIRHSGAQFCPMGIVTLEYAIPLEATVGHNRIAAFTVQDGDVRGQSSIEIPLDAIERSNLRATLASASQDAVRGSGTDQRYSLGAVAAWVNHMPPGPTGLHAVAQVHANSTGWRFALEPAVPQGFNPNNLVLELKATPPSGPVLWIMTDYEARYDVTSYAGSHTHVTARDGDVAITTRIRNVS